MMLEVAPTNLPGLLALVADYETLKRIINALSKQEDVDDQDIAWTIESALKRWPPPRT